jgi:hypothetical protein
VTVNPNDSQVASSPRQLAANIVDVTAKADWLSPLLFGLAPLALLHRGWRRAAGWIWLFVGYVFFEWWLLTHRLDRFWVPLIPLVAVLSGAGAVWSKHAWWRRFVTTVMVAAVFYNFSYSSSALCGFNDYARPVVPDEDPTDAAVTWMNRNLPDSARVLAVGAADLFHLRRPVIYNTVFDDSIFEQLVRDRTPAEAGVSLRERGVTHVYVSWSEIDRYRQPGSYGYSDFVTPSVFQSLVKASVLGPSVPLGPAIPIQMTGHVEKVPAQALYPVRAKSSP